jgi:hypothetical protein
MVVSSGESKFASMGRTGAGAAFSLIDNRGTLLLSFP